MSQYIILKGWSGSDMEDAARRLAKVFRMSPNRGVNIMEEINSGTSWQFERTISDEQASLAKTYLEQLGFSLETHPAGAVIEEKDSSPEPAPRPEETTPGVDATSPAEKPAIKSTPARKDSILGKLFKKEPLHEVGQDAAPPKKPFDLKSFLGSLFAKKGSKQAEAPPPPGAPGRKSWFSKVDKPVEKQSPALDEPYKMGFSAPKKAPLAIHEKTKSSPVAVLFLILILSVIVAAVGLPYWVGMQIETRFKDLTARVSSDGDTVWINQRFERKWFDSTAEDIVKFSGMPFDLKLVHNIFHGPILFNELLKDDPVQNILRVLNGDYQSFMAQAYVKSQVSFDSGLIKNFPPLEVHTRIDLKGDIRNQYETASYQNTSNPKRTVNWQGLSGDSQMPQDHSRFKGHLSIMPIMATLDQATIFLTGMNLDWDLKKQALGMWLGPVTWSLDQVSIKDEKETISGNRFLVLFESGIAGDQLSFKAQARVDEIKNGQTVYGPGLIHTDFKNLDANTFAKIRGLALQMKNNQDPQLQQKMMGLLTALVKKSPAWEISKFEFKTPEGELIGRTRFGVEGTQIVENNPFSILSALSANAELAAPKSIFQNEYVFKDSKSSEEIKIQLPIKLWEKQGYLVSEENRYKLLIEYKNGLLTLNGKPFQPPMTG